MAPRVTEETPLLRKRAATSGLVRSKRMSMRELNASSTMLDRLIYHYDHRPGRQTGFWPKAGMTSAHYSYGDFEDIMGGGSSVESVVSEIVGEGMASVNPVAYECLVHNDYPLELEISDCDGHKASAAISPEPLNGWPRWVSGTYNIHADLKNWVISGTHGEIIARSQEQNTGGNAPHEVTQWLDASGGVCRNMTVTVPPTTFLTVAAFAALVIGVTAMSSIGPVATKFAAVNGMLLGCWIAQALFAAFTLVSILSSTFTSSSTSYPRPPSWLLEWSSTDGPGGLQVVVLAGIFSGVGSGCWTMSFNLTPVPLAYLFASFSPSVIVLCRTFAASAGAPPSRFEVLGVIVGVLGGFLTCFGSGGAVVGAFGLGQLMGNSLAFVCSVSNAICGMCGKFASCVPTSHYLTGVCLLSAVTQGCLAWVALPAVSFSSDPYSGVFGWTHPQWHIPFTLIVSSFMIGQWGIFFFLQVGTALQQAAVMTTQPIIATFLGVIIFGTQPSWPDWTSTIGGLVSITGSLVVIVSGYQHEIEPEH